MQHKNKITLKVISVFLLAFGLSACVNVPPNKMTMEKSYLETEEEPSTAIDPERLTANKSLSEEDVTETARRFRFVAPLKLNTSQAKTAEDVLNQFSDEKTFKITADNLSLQDFLHQTLGEQLGVSYILSDDIKNDKQSVTLNLQKAISEKKLFTLMEELLVEREYLLRFDDNIFYIHKSDQKNNKGDVIYGYGNKLSDIPNSSLNIIQIIPFEFGMPSSISLTLRQLLGINAKQDLQNSSLTIQGKRKDIVRAMEFVQMMDKPTMKNRQIGLYRTTFLDGNKLIPKLREILNQEGISLGGANTSNGALSIVELDKQGVLIFFANNTQVIERALFWLNQIDQPLKTVENQYFIYHPKFSRAADMGDSLEALIADGKSSSVGTSTSAADQNKGIARATVRSASSKTMKMVVDERANALIFHTSGKEYQQLLPLIKRLDVLPKQVMLEVVIAEVTLSDSFKSGVDFVLGNQGATKTGGFTLSSGSSGLSYILSGSQGSLSVNLLSTNSNVNVLSRPSLLVRDGVTASIAVGDDIPTVGEIVTDPVNGSRSSIVYRKTGIDLSVTPTINARGVIIMAIDQTISNQATGGDAVDGSPTIFERSIGTEVIAQSGQTIVLGGLISENSAQNDSGVPFFSSIPIIGYLFEQKSESKDKTELVVLVTPRVLDSNDEWQEVKDKFMTSFTEVRLD